MSTISEEDLGATGPIRPTAEKPSKIAETISKYVSGQCVSYDHKLAFHPRIWLVRRLTQTTLFNQNLTFHIRYGFLGY